MIVRRDPVTRVSIVQHAWQEDTRTSEDVEAQLRRYAPRYRRALHRHGEASPRFADLLFSFPAACVALVTARGPLRRRAMAVGLVHMGAPLADVASALQLPSWLRRLPPEAFDRPLPARMAESNDAEFGRRVITLLPIGHQNLGCWLHWVLAARAVGGDEFALWIAAQPIFAAKRLPPANALLPLAMFAWFSRQPEHDAAGLMTSRWTRKMSIGRAAYLTRRWLHRVLQDLCLALPASGSVWAQARQVRGLDFVPLLTSDQLVEEGVRMHNCLATYSSYVVHGVCRLYSIRCNGVSVATMDVRTMQGTNAPGIAQLRAPRNTKAPPEVCEAALAWLVLQLRDAGGTDTFNWGTPTDAAFAKHVWQPYAAARKAKGGQELLPPSVTTLLNDIGTLCTLEKS